jgi:Cu(I)/Ag(I) efflux system membrane fusion protein
MKIKVLLLVVLAAAGGAGATWFYSQQHPMMQTTAVSGRKILYYQSAMHPWIKSDKPGKCPICGMNLVPIYEGDAGMDTNMTPGTGKLNAGSVSVINVQTETVINQPLVRSLYFSGQIMANSSQQAWFEFTVYERDLPWLKIGQPRRSSCTGSNRSPTRISTT